MGWTAHDGDYGSRIHKVDNRSMNMGWDWYWLVGSAVVDFVNDEAAGAYIAWLYATGQLGG